MRFAWTSIEVSQDARQGRLPHPTLRGTSLLRRDPTEKLGRRSSMRRMWATLVLGVSIVCSTAARADAPLEGAEITRGKTVSRSLLAGTLTQEDRMRLAAVGIAKPDSGL